MLSRQPLMLFEILGETAGRPVPVDEIAARLYGDAEWPPAYTAVIASAASKLRPILAELGLGIMCRLRTYWLCDADDDCTISGYRHPGLGFNQRSRQSRDAVRNAAVIAARRHHLVSRRAGR